MAVRPIPLETTDDVAREDQVGMLIAGVNGLDTGAWRLVGGSADGEALLQLANSGTGQGLTVTDGATIDDLTVSGALGVGGSVGIGGNLEVDGTVGSDGLVTARAGAVVIGNLTVRNATPTTLLAAVVTAGAQTLTVGSASTPGLYHDVANTRTLIGSATALSGASNDRFAVIGGTAYFAPDSSPSAIGLRYSATSGSVFLGASNSATPNLVVANNGGTQLLTALTGGTVVVGTATAAAGSEKLRVQGAGRFEGQVVVTTGGLDITGSSTFDAIQADGASLFTAGLTVQGNMAVQTGNFDATGGNATLAGAANNLGFFAAAGTTKQTVSGSRGGNAALGSLLAALASYGQITDSTTA